MLSLIVLESFGWPEKRADISQCNHWFPGEMTFAHPLHPPPRSAPVNKHNSGIFQTGTLHPWKAQWAMLVFGFASYTFVF